ncbi:MAG TPA: MFS transporter [Candidatus Acidoferrales bacterium]|nr:MFS transporter [Candidatus Acidoferrales bacterium]
MRSTLQEKPFYGWKLLVIFWAIIILNFAFPTFGTSVVNTYMAKAMHLNRKELGLAFSVFSLMAGLPGPLVAKSINTLGIRRTLVVGTLVTSCGALLMALIVRTTSQAILVLGFIVGSGAAMAGTIAPQVGIARWFHRKRARAMSLLLTASGIGGLIAVPTLNAVVAHFGGNWRAAWCCMGAMSMVAAIVSALFVRESPSELNQSPDGEVGIDPSSSRPSASSERRVFKTTEDWTLSEALKSPTLWLLVSTYLGFFMGFFVYLAHGILHLEALGHTPGEAARSISVIFASSLIGQMAVAWLGDRIEPRWISAVAVCLYGAGTLVSLHASSTVIMYVYAIMMGTGFAAAFTCIMTIWSNYYGPKLYPALLGVTTPIGTILGAIGPFTAGYIYDKYGTYVPVFEAIAALCLLTAFLYLLAVPPVRRVADSKATAAVRTT